MTVDYSYSFTSEDSVKLVEAGYDPEDFTHMTILKNRISFYYCDMPVFGMQLKIGLGVGALIARNLPRYLRGAR